MGQEPAELISESYDDIEVASDNGTALQNDAHRDAGERLQAARAAARDRYQLIALAIKMEAGVTRHYTHKSISGLAWSDKGRILAPEGITRRQLYVLAHECGHIVLHNTPAKWSKPGHVKELEAEIYAHRTFQRYGLEVPARSSQWARQYVGQWIMRDKAEGIPIAREAAEFAQGHRSPSDPLPAVDGMPNHDFSKRIERFIAKGTRIAEQQEAVMQPFDGRAQTYPPENPDNLPIACGTCRYRGAFKYSDCNVHLAPMSSAWASGCHYGRSWRAPKRWLFGRILDALIDRIAGRYRTDVPNSRTLPPQQARKVIRIDDRP